MYDPIEIALMRKIGGSASGGGGDMQKSTYDPNGVVAAAGGIPAYVTNAIQTAVTAAMEASY